jgi:hypothetical protein
MFSIIDLIISLILAILFVLMFKFKKRVMPYSYFSSSQLILGNCVTVKMMVMRFCIIFIFGILSFLVIREEPIVLLGVLLGSLLIVWPVLLNPSEIYYWNLKGFDFILLILSHIFFVVSSFSIVYLSILLFPIVSDFTIEKIKDLTSDFIVWIILAIFGFPAKQILDKHLEKVLVNRTKQTSLETPVYEEYAEHAATKE